MKPSLTKIYFQDPFINGEFLRKRFALATPQEAYENYRRNTGEMKTLFRLPQRDFGVEIEHISSTDQFYIPVEV